jgi:hypothetical protein
MFFLFVLFSPLTIRSPARSFDSIPLHFSPPPTLHPVRLSSSLPAEYISQNSPKLLFRYRNQCDVICNQPFHQWIDNITIDLQGMRSYCTEKNRWDIERRVEVEVEVERCDETNNKEIRSLDFNEYGGRCC